MRLAEHLASTKDGVIVVAMTRVDANLIAAALQAAHASSESGHRHWTLSESLRRLRDAATAWQVALLKP